MERFKQILTVLALLSLSACAPLEKAVNPYQEDFKCHASDATGKCIDTPSAYKEARYPNIKEPSSPEIISESSEPDQRYQMVAGLLSEPQKPLLQPPKIMRVLLLPYTGEENELFMSRYVYLKVEDSDWILSNIGENQEQL